jgi:hypothetical protein
MGFIDRATRLDNKVLGPSDSTRGFAANLFFLGLNPVLAPVWLVVAVLLIGSGGWVMLRGNVYGGLPPLLVGLVAAARAYASWTLPLWPRSMRRR